MHVLGRRTARGGNHQFAPILVQQHDRTHGGVHSLGHHLGDRLQDAIQIALGGDRLRHRGQSLHAPDGADRLLSQPRFGEHAAHLLADEAHHCDLVRRVLVRLFVMHVDDTDQVAAADQRHRKKGFEGVFRQRLEGFEPGIRRRIGAQGYHRLVQCYPAGNTLTHLHADLSDFRIVRKLRRLQDNLVGGAVDQVHEARIAMGNLHCQ